MELDWLEDFLAICEYQHFTRAAEKRNTSQSSLSRRIKMLEDWVGAPLFARDTRYTKLTETGEQFKPTAEEVLRRLHFGRKRAIEAASASAETLSIVTTHAVSVNFLPHWLQEIEATLSNQLNVNLITENLADCERIMSGGRANFLVCHYHPARPVTLRPNYFLFLEIGSDALVPVSAPIAEESPDPRFPLPGSSSAPVPHLAYSDYSGMSRILGAAHELTGLSAWLSTIFVAHVAEALAAMARVGKGVGWVPLSIVKNDLARGLLVRAGSEEWDIPMKIRMYRPRARQSVAAEAFWVAIKDLAASLLTENERQ